MVVIKSRLSFNHDNHGSDTYLRHIPYVDAYRKYSLTYAKIMHTLYAYSGGDFMRTTLNISDKLIEDLHRFSQEKSKTKAVSIAIEDYIKRKKIERLLSLPGKINIDYDWEKEEERETELEKQEKKG